MKPKLRGSSGSKMKVVGVLVGAAVGGWVAYQTFKPGTSPLPEAIDAERIYFTSGLAGLVSYYVDRQNQDRPLVLAHSINAAASSFEMKPLFQHYRSSRPVYALEWPGYGFSERSSKRPYLPELFTQTFIDMLATQVGEAADVIALSLGCEFAARAATLRPELFNSLTLLSPTGLSRREIDLPGEKLYEIFSFPVWSQPFFDLLTSRPSIHYYLGKNFVGEVPEEFVDYAYAAAHQPDARFAPLYFLSGQMFSPDILPTVYQQLTVPTLIIYDRDPNVSFEKLPDLLADNHACLAQRVAPTLGLAHWDQLAQTTAVLDKFWVEITR